MNIDKRLLRRTRDTRKEFYLTVGLGFLGGVFTVLQAWLLSNTIDGVFLRHRALGALLTAILLLVGAIAARALTVWGSEVAASRMAAKVKLALREQLFAHITALGPAYVHGERTGELTNTVVEGIEALDAYFSQYIPQLALAAIIPATVLVFVFPLDSLSGVVMLVTVPVIPVFMVLIGSIADQLTKRQWESLSRMSAHFLDVLQGLTTLKILGRGRDHIHVIAMISDRFRRATLGVLRVAFLSALVLELAATISTAVVAVEVGLRLLYGHLEFRQAFFVLLLAPEFYLPLRLLGARFHAGMSGVAAARRIFQVMETPLPPTPERVHPLPAGLRFDIRFDGVSYAYEGGDRPALEGVTFHIPHGKRTALVGPTGAGKSTVAGLLLRFISPDPGWIAVDGIPLGEVPKREWLSLVGWVPQSPYLFHGTVAENIRMARPDADMEDVIRAAKLAHAHEFVVEFPQGYDTLIGERGARLSGGQAQRVALARAFLKDAPFLILDEATSNLDPEVESLIQDATERLMQGKTVLVIAHRLNTVRRADVIVVLDHGRVVETGAHRELLRQGGLYARLASAYGGAT